MTDMRKILTAIFALGLCLGTAAQNLNQTVSISNTYLSGSEDEEKQYVPVALPDSLTRFSYKFDYSVFETPYKGAFEFSPYSVRMIPDSSVPDSRALFVRAGAGYGLYPQLQAVWNPLHNGKFSLNVHQDFHGYAGNYRTVCKEQGENAMLTFKDKRFRGYDFSENFGVRGKWNSEKFDAGFDVSYNGIFNKDDVVDGNRFNSVSAGAGIASKYGSAGKFRYDVNLIAEYAVDAPDHSFERVGLSQQSADLTVSVEPRVSREFALQIDARLKFVNYSDAGDFAYTYLGYALAPHIALNLGPVDLKAGVRIDGTDRLKIAPDVLASVVFLEKIRIFASVTGGTTFNSYTDMRRANHWFCPGYSESLRNTFEQINASIGFEGGIASRLQYRLKGGFAMADDLPLWGVKAVSGKKLAPLLTFVGCRYAYADLSLVWRSPRFDADGTLAFRKSNLNGSTSVFDMPLLSGNLRAAYNWNRRIFAGVKMNASMASQAALGGVSMKLPAYVDLGVYGEYRINRRWSVWLEGGNLLNEAIQITPMHVENGINGTIGIVFSL